MFVRPLIGFAGVLLALGALSMALPGCGGGQTTGTGANVQNAPPVNPAPGAVPIDQESSPTNPALKKK